MKIGKGFLMVGVLVLGLSGVGGMVESADATLVSQVDFTGGAVNWEGNQGRRLDRVFDQEGTIKMGEYQSWSEIVNPIGTGHRSYSLFTSGVFGAPAPSATIDGMSITLDLSSLFFGVKHGNELRAWNIGGQATGLFNPETSEFCLSWEHLFNGGKYDHVRDDIGTFFLQGKGTVGAPAAVAIPASVFLYGTGLFGVGSWTWLKRRRQALTTS